MDGYRGSSRGEQCWEWPYAGLSDAIDNPILSPPRELKAFTESLAKWRVPGGRLHLGVIKRFSDHREALPERQGFARDTVPKVMDTVEVLPGALCGSGGGSAKLSAMRHCPRNPAVAFVRMVVCVTASVNSCGHIVPNCGSLHRRRKASFVGHDDALEVLPTDSSTLRDILHGHKSALAESTWQPAPTFR